MRHGTCFRRRLSAHHAGAAPLSAVAELGVVRRRYARCVQRSLSPSFPFTDAFICLSRLSSSQQASVPGTSSLSVRRSPFVSLSIPYPVLSGVACRICAQVTATGGSLPVPSPRFGRQSATFSTQAATPNQALQRTAPCVTAPASATTFPPTMQVPRRTPLSLSLGSLGVATRHLLKKSKPTKQDQ